MTAQLIVHSVCMCGKVSFKQKSREEEYQNQQCLQKICLLANRLLPLHLAFPSKLMKEGKVKGTQ